MKRWGEQACLTGYTGPQACVCTLGSGHSLPVAGAVALLVVLCGCMLWVSPSYAAVTNVVSVQESPAKALENVQSALDTGDLALFDQHVDVESLVRAGVDFVLADAQSGGGGSQLPPVLAMILSTVGQSETGKMSFRSLVGGEARNFVVYGVQSGSFAGSTLANVPPPEGLLAPLFADASLGRKEIRQAQRPQMRGSDCLISFVVYDYGNGRSYPVHGLWQVVQGHWRLVQVENLSALITQIRGEAEE